MTANRLFLLHHRNLQNRQHGFTFIELMMTITVLAILIGAALPAFGTFITSNRLSAQINELVGDLALARNEAAARSQRVQVCIASSATSCAATGSDWSAGRIVWADTNGNNSIDANEIIKYLPPLEGNVTLIASGPANTSTLSFLPQGLLATATNTWTFTLCAPGTSNGRQVTLPISGRATAKENIDLLMSDTPMNKMPHHSQYQTGVTILEVLVSIVVLSLGLFGLLGLLTNGMKMTSSSQYRTVAAQQLSAMADMISASPTLYATYASPTAANNIATCMTNTGCTPAILPNNDYYLWQQNLSTLLPGGTGVVCRDSTPSDGNSTTPACDNTGRITIKICWNENARIAISRGGASGSDTSTDSCLSEQL